MERDLSFSVLMSVYHKEQADYFDLALDSIEKQTLEPAEIVVVKDGPLTTDLEAVLSRHIEMSGIPYRVVALAKNKGLADALNAGLEVCRYEWIARMDSDDIAFPDRFEEQIAYIKEHPEVDVLGGWFAEFDNDPKQITSWRKVPTSHGEIVRYIRWRCPFNHGSVIYKKSKVFEAGGYVPGAMEDYSLWLRMAAKDTSFANLNRPLVYFRAGEWMYERRRGWRYAKDEWSLACEAYRYNAWPLHRACINAAVRSSIRLFPAGLIKKVYNLLRKF